MASPIVPVRASAAAKERWEEAARTAGESLSEWMRNILDAAAAAPARARGARTGFCPHRRGPDEYCSRCDP